MTHSRYPATEFGLTVGGVGLQVELPAAWAADCVPLYTEFPLSGPPSWRIIVQHDPQLPAAQPRWIRHAGDITHFHIDHFAGWIDLQQKTVQISTSAPQHSASAIERGAGYACMHALLREHNSVLLHAAGIRWRGHGLVVSGHSGAGKSTLSRLALSQGEPVNDEMVIVDFSSASPLLHSTPFLSPGTPPEMRRRINRTFPATALLLLAHAPDFRLTPLEPAEAVLELLRTNIAAVERFSSATAWMAMIDRLLVALPVYRLHFRPTPDVWDFLAAALPQLEPCAS